MKSLNYESISEKVFADKSKQTKSKAPIIAFVRGTLLLKELKEVNAILETEAAFEYFLRIKPEKKPNFYNLVRKNPTQVVQGEGVFAELVKAFRAEVIKDPMMNNYVLSFKAMMYYYSPLLAKNLMLYRNPIVAMSISKEVWRALIDHVLKCLEGMKKASSKEKHSITLKNVTIMAATEITNKDGTISIKKFPKQIEQHIYELEVPKFEEPATDKVIDSLPDLFWKIISKNILLEPADKNALRLRLSVGMKAHFELKDEHKSSFPYFMKLYKGLHNKFRLTNVPSVDVDFIKDIEEEAEKRNTQFKTNAAQIKATAPSSATGLPAAVPKTSVSLSSDPSATPVNPISTKTTQNKTPSNPSLPFAAMNAEDQGKIWISAVEGLLAISDEVGTFVFYTLNFNTPSPKFYKERVDDINDKVKMHLDLKNKALIIIGDYDGTVSKAKIVSDHNKSKLINFGTGKNYLNIV